jgi:hypothetical protein
MPPKPAPSKPSKKTEAKKKEKVIEDKTFGLKNKKGAKQQKFIQQVEKQVKSGGQPVKRVEDPKKKPVDELDIKDIFKPVTQTQKIEKGADPKSVLCAFFKQGQCAKGDKCKFSHDLTIERKAEKRSLYDDVRTEDTMDLWDDAKLQEVVEKKHGEAERGMPKTDIICKFFLDAVEKSKYGWFWECPNGADCHYRHALPPGFLLKKDKIKEIKNEISLEDLIEKERAALGSSLTKVTLATFIAWKKRKIEQKRQDNLQEEEKKKADFKAGRQVGLSGRDMFTFNPNMAIETDDYEEGDAAWDGVREEDGSEDENIEYRELDTATWEMTEEEAAAAQIADLKLKEEVPIDEDLFLDDDLDESLDEDEEE